MIRIPRLHDIGEAMLCESGWSDISDDDRKLNIQRLITKTPWVLQESNPVYFMLNHYLYRLGRTNMPYTKVDNDTLSTDVIAYCMQDAMRNVNADHIRPDDVLIDDVAPQGKTRLQAKTKVSVRHDAGKEVASTWGNVMMVIVKNMKRSRIGTVGDLAHAICRLAPSMCDVVLSPREIDEIKKDDKDAKKGDADKREDKKKERKSTGGKLYNPLGDKARLTSRFRVRKLKSETKADMHAGVDLAAKRGTPVYAIADGVVRKVNKNSKGYGAYVLLDHPGLRHMDLPLSSLYAHVGEIAVEEGDKVERGQQIAVVDLVGTYTGSHLHFEIRVTDDKGENDLVVDDKDMQRDQPWPLGRLWRSGYGNYNFNPLEMSYSPSLPRPLDKNGSTA